MNFRVLFPIFSQVSLMLMGYGPAHCLNVVSIILGGSAAYNYTISAPTYDVAFEDAQANFPDLFNATHTFRQTIVRVSQGKTCDEEVNLLHEAVGDVYLLLSRLNGLTILQSPGCTDMAVVLGDFARELNLPLIISTGGGTRFLERRQYPTLLGFAPVDHGTLRDGAMALLQLYNWTTVTLLCGCLHGLASTYTIATCETFSKGVADLPQTYDVSRIDYAPERSDQYDLILRRAKEQSRIIFVFCELDFLKLLMAAASALNMTHGDFMFLSPQPLIFSSQLRGSWGANSVSKTSVESLIIYSNVVPNWTLHAETAKRISRLASTRYFARFPLESVNTLNLAAYEGFLSLSQALQELTTISADRDDVQSIKDPVDMITTQRLVEIFRNRGFILKSGSRVFINQDGIRRVGVQFMRLNTKTLEYEIGWQYHIITGQLEIRPLIANLWATESGPPQNRPLCGFRDDQCPQIRGAGIIIGEVLAIVAVALLLAASVPCFFILYSRKHGHGVLLGMVHPWRPLDPTALTPFGRQNVSSNVRVRQYTEEDMQRITVGPPPLRFVVRCRPPQPLVCTIEDHSWASV